MESKIKIYETESQYFGLNNHFILRIQEMEKKSVYGAEVAKKWT
ncbi:hypothetical protein [Paenibacillus sp. MER 180]|nr:hypothetical protein [Paenibacillus sp. MER 180]